MQHIYIICFPSVRGIFLEISAYSFPVAPPVPRGGIIARALSGEDTVVGITKFLRIRCGRVINDPIGTDRWEGMILRERALAGAQLKQNQDASTKMNPEPHDEWRLLHTANGRRRGIVNLSNL